MEHAPRHTRSRFQVLAIAVCVMLGAAMILNTQMGGEAMWFEYASAFHRGAHLYSDLHIALQPLFVLETSAWMTLFGHRIAVTQMPSLLTILIVCAGLYLVLKQSDWTDWQKACVLLGAFCITVFGHSYRFDDYHVVAESLILYSLLLLLHAAKPNSHRREFALAVGLGLLAGLTITTRLTDGAALLAADLLMLPFLLRTRRAVSVGMFFAAATVTVILVVLCTGDSLSAWLFSSVIRAAGSKGGTGSIFAAPFLALRNTVPTLLKIGKQMVVGLAALITMGPLICRFWKAGIRYIFAIQVGLAAVIYACLPYAKKDGMLHGLPVSSSVLFLAVLLYGLTPIVLTRWALARRGHRAWDAREILVLLPLAEWASYTAGAAAEPLTNYYAPVALLLLLVPTVQPFRRWNNWVAPSFAFLMLLLATSTLTSKYITPYSWQQYVFSSMFRDRQVYDHPIYGRMYIDKDLLTFSKAVCADIGATPGTHPELLSLPYPFPNYFCDTPPWHNYVQTFFDTSTRATINHLMDELNTAPPKYIVYQRQLYILSGAEHLYNHDQPLAQRDLDTMIMRKLDAREWKLIERRQFLQDDGWYIIQTHP